LDGLALSLGRVLLRRLRRSRKCRKTKSLYESIHNNQQKGEVKGRKEIPFIVFDL
jgi:hypothetical protein